MEDMIVELLICLLWAMGIVGFFSVLFYVLDPQNKRRKF